MAYVPDWEGLADALKRVMSAGVAEEEAKTDICNAIADRHIRVRFHTSKVWAEGKPGGSIGTAQTVCDGSEVDIPASLRRFDFDWQKSRPVASWRKHGPDPWTLPYIEMVDRMDVFAPDVTKVLCDARNAAMTRLKKSKRGRPAEYNWDGVKQRLSTYVAKHGPVQTLNELLQKCAEFAGELHPKNSAPSDKTIRDAIKTHSLDVAAGFVPGK